MIFRSISITWQRVLTVKVQTEDLSRCWCRCGPLPIFRVLRVWGQPCTRSMQETLLECSTYASEGGKGVGYAGGLVSGQGWLSRAEGHCLCSRRTDQQLKELECSTLSFTLSSTLSPRLGRPQLQPPSKSANRSCGRALFPNQLISAYTAHQCMCNKYT